MILAAVDIGSNAARLLITEVRKIGKNTEYTKLNLLRIPLRLGIDVFSKGEISNERQEMFLKTMSVFQSLMEIYQVQHYRACATSAMRDAKNGKEIIEKTKENTGINIEIISGDEEATLIYENHVAEGLDDKNAYLYIDVGGGSTELSLYENNKLKFKKSINIGTIRMLKNGVNDDKWKELKDEIKSNFSSDKPIVAIGSGGNINKVFSLSKTKEGKPIELNFLKKMYKDFSELSVEDRMKNHKLRQDRADVIVPALKIYTSVLQWAGISKIMVPKISVADGLIHHLYEKYKRS